MDQFPAFHPCVERGFGYLMSGTLRDDQWTFQNDLNLSKKCYHPQSPLQQLHYAKGSNDIFSGYKYNKKEQTNFSKLNPLLIPSALIQEALDETFPEYFFVDNLVAEMEGNIIFSNGICGEELHMLTSNGNLKCMLNFPVSINQIFPINEKLLAVRLYDSIELYSNGKSDFEIKEVFHRNDEEPSNIASASFPTSELLVSTFDGNITFFNYNSEKVTEVNVGNILKSTKLNYFKATFGLTSNYLLYANNFEELYLGDRRIRNHFLPISKTDSFSKFAFLNENVAFALNKDKSTFFDMRMLNRPALVDSEAGGSFYFRKDDSSDIYIYNSAANSLKLHFYNESFNMIDAPACKIPTCNLNNRELRGYCIIESSCSASSINSSSSFHLYSDGSLFKQKFTIAPYSQSYVSLVNSHHKTTLLEPFVSCKKDPFIPIKPFKSIDVRTVKSLFHITQPDAKHSVDKKSVTADNDDRASGQILLNESQTLFDDTCENINSTPTEPSSILDAESSSILDAKSSSILDAESVIKSNPTISLLSSLWETSESQKDENDKVPSTSAPSNLSQSHSSSQLKRLHNFNSSQLFRNTTDTSKSSKKQSHRKPGF